MTAMQGYREGRGLSMRAEAPAATPRTRRESHKKAWQPGCLEEPQRDLGISCADLSRSEGPFNEMVAEGVLPNPPDPKRVLCLIRSGSRTGLNMLLFFSLFPPSGLFVQDFLVSQCSPLVLRILDFQESQLFSNHL